MKKINFKNGASGKTPLNATNLNKMQDNIEDGINNVKNNIKNFSTEEQKIGTWTNGKPLYRKCLKTTVPPTTIDGTYIDSIITIGDNIEFAFIEFACFKTNTGATYTMPYMSNAGHSIKALINENKEVRIINGVTAYSSFIATVSVLYTKTTD